MHLPGNERAAAESLAAIFIRCALGAIFVFAGALKVVHPDDFYSNLLAYETSLPDDLLRLVALSLPWFEILCGVGLLGRIWIETVAYLVAVTCLVFVVMLAQAVARGLDLNCGCFGPIGEGWWERPVVALVRAVLLLATSAWLVLSQGRRSQPHGSHSRQ